MKLVDLHVHTPASSCYQCKGDLTIEEHYLNVLDVYRKKNINLIAITDHNTLKGYRKLIEIKNQLEENLKNNESDEESKKRLKLYESVKLIPGVEFTAYPHIHILILFGPNVDLNKVEAFLERAGYDDDYKKGRDLDNILKLDVEGILKKGKELGGLTIAAHIDRETGLLTWLEDEGVEDKSIFNSKYLDGVHVLKQETVSKLKDGILKDKESIFFINASDFHNEISDMEKRATFIEIEENDYNSLEMGLKERKIKLQWD